MYLYATIQGTRREGAEQEKEQIIPGEKEREETEEEGNEGETEEKLDEGFRWVISVIKKVRYKI